MNNHQFRAARFAALAAKHGPLESDDVAEKPARAVKLRPAKAATKRPKRAK